MKGEPCIGPNSMTGRCNMILCGDITDGTRRIQALYYLFDRQKVHIPLQKGITGCDKLTNDKLLVSNKTAEQR